MDFRALQRQNALLSIRVSLESDSNVNDEREEQSKKHSWQISRTDDGMQIDFNAWQEENALLSIRVSFEFDSNVNDEREEQFARQ
jgi:hypothetical protein